MSKSLITPSYTGISVYIQNLHPMTIKQTFMCLGAPYKMSTDQVISRVVYQCMIRLACSCGDILHNDLMIRRHRVKVGVH